MAIQSPPRPGFKRTSERKVIDPNEQVTVEADRREQRRLEAFESIGCPAAAASVLVTKPKFEVLMDAIEADDAQFYAEHEG